MFAFPNPSVQNGSFTLLKDQSVNGGQVRYLVISINTGLSQLDGGTGETMYNILKGIL